jgi:hypothetical protein
MADPKKFEYEQFSSTGSRYLDIAIDPKDNEVMISVDGESIFLRKEIARELRDFLNKEVKD